MEKKVCFGCFSDQHIAKNCKEGQTCKTCKRQHPTSLHDYDWAKKTSYNSANKSGAEPSQARSVVIFSSTHKYM